MKWISGWNRCLVKFAWFSRVSLIIAFLCIHCCAVYADDTEESDNDILDFLVPIAANIGNDPWRIRPLWEQHAFYCPEAAIDGVSVAKFPSKQHDNGECDDGDMTLFNGLLCASGDERGCDGVRRAQSPDGRFWRSPRRAAARSDNFSADMSLGILLYVAKTGDYQALSRWLNWIENTRKSRPWPTCEYVKKEVLGKDVFFEVCAPDLPRVCEGIDCLLSPISVDLIRETAFAFGIDPPDGIKNYYKLLNIAGLQNLTWLYPVAAPLSSLYLGEDTCGKLAWDIKTSGENYPRHLNGVRVLLMRMLNLGDAQRINDEAIKLSDYEKENPFFAYLKEGPSSPVRNQTLNLCPATLEDIQNSGRSQWAWERPDSEMAWENSMLWDCIFMANMFTKVKPVEYKTPHLADNFICYPNPVSKSRGTIRCRLRVEQEPPNTAAVQIDFFNSAGARVVEYHDVVEVGEDVFREVNIENLGVGCYLARLSFAASCLGDSRKAKFCVIK